MENEAKLSQHELEDHTDCEQCMEDIRGMFIDENKLAGLYDPLFERKDL